MTAHSKARDSKQSVMDTRQAINGIRNRNAVRSAAFFLSRSRLSATDSDMFVGTGVSRGSQYTHGGKPSPHSVKYVDEWFLVGKQLPRHYI